MRSNEQPAPTPESLVYASRTNAFYAWLWLLGMGVVGVLTIVGLVLVVRRFRT